MSATGNGQTPATYAIAGAHGRRRLPPDKHTSNPKTMWRALVIIIVFVCRQNNVVMHNNEVVTLPSDSPNYIGSGPPTPGPGSNTGHSIRPLPAVARVSKITPDSYMYEDHPVVYHENIYVTCRHSLAPDKLNLPVLLGDRYTMSLHTNLVLHCSFLDTSDHFFYLRPMQLVASSWLSIPITTRPIANHKQFSGDLGMCNTTTIGKPRKINMMQQHSELNWLLYTERPQARCKKRKLCVPGQMIVSGPQTSAF